MNNAETLIYLLNRKGENKIKVYNKLKLKIPTYEELLYRKKLLSDVETMSYNIGFGEFEGYDNETGCIDFNQNCWEKWFDNWIDNTPERYYAYIIKNDENIPIGEASLRFDKEKNAYCISIVIEYKYRGNGYSEEALILLVEIAFNELNIEKVFDNFPDSRVSAEKVFKKVGFKRISEEIVELTKEDYINSPKLNHRLYKNLLN